VLHRPVETAGVIGKFRQSRPISTNGNSSNLGILYLFVYRSASQLRIHIRQSAGKVIPCPNQRLTPTATSAKC
jgi:hypothetical protein